jgi:hypothetical protein
MLLRSPCVTIGDHMPLAYLDQNIYGNLERGADEETLTKILAGRGLTVAASMVLLQEAARIPTAEQRDSRIQRIKRIASHHLQPNTYLESQDLLGEIRRRRPDWLRLRPSRGKVDRILRFWRRWMASDVRVEGGLEFLRDIHMLEIDFNKQPHKEIRGVARDPNATSRVSSVATRRSSTRSCCPRPQEHGSQRSVTTTACSSSGPCTSREKGSSASTALHCSIGSHTYPIWRTTPART